MAATALLALLLAAPPLPLSGALSAPPPAPRPAPAARAAPSGPPPPADWPLRRISPQEYPFEALEAGAQGFVAYRLDIGPDGQVSHCSILRSSGSAALDAGTCRIVSGRARFTPARDGEGRPVADRRDGWVTWRLQDEEREE